MKQLLFISVLFIVSCQKEPDYIIFKRPLFYRLAVYDLDGSVNHSKTLYIKVTEIISEKGKDKDDKCLPLFYSYISIQGINNRAVLRWKTTYEQNLDKFVVERSFDGVDFAPIGVVKPKGANVEYVYVD